MVMKDNAIIELFFARDERAIKITAEKYGNYCNAIAGNILNNREDAEECVNDTYLRAWNSIPPHRPLVLKTYLGKLTRNLAFDLYKKRTAEKRGGGEISAVLDELAECIAGENDPAKEFDKVELQETINIFLGTLSKEKCAVFVRRYWYVESIPEIAERYDMTENHVSVILTRLRKQLRSYLAERGFEL